MLEKRSTKKRLQADIPCKPILKIVEDDMVVGILTETNQFIQISNPVPEVEINAKKNIPSFKDDNYIINKNNKPMISSDTVITTSQKVDDARVEYIKKIKLETNFYLLTLHDILNGFQERFAHQRFNNFITIKQAYVNFIKRFRFEFNYKSFLIFNYK
jgi:hypothetical protein